MEYITALDRFREKIRIQDDGCWIFTSYVGKNGYGRFKLYGRLRLAHRVSYEIFIGEVPAGYVLHHTCENKACVRPEHLYPTTSRNHIVYISENAPACKNRKKTHCKRGHELTPENTYIWGKRGIGRQCRTCKRDQIRNARHAENPSKRNYSKRISAADACVIRSLAEVGVSTKLVAALYGIRRGYVSNIKLGINWGSVNSASLSL
jgi:hypothetical protein